MRLRVKGQLGESGFKGKRRTLGSKEIGKTEDREQDVQNLWALDNCEELGRAGAQGEGRARGADRRETEQAPAMACPVTPNPSTGNLFPLCYSV